MLALVFYKKSTSVWKSAQLSRYFATTQILMSAMIKRRCNSDGHKQHQNQDSMSWDFSLYLWNTPRLWR